MAWLRKNVAIDLGTTSVLVFTRAEGVKLQEPSVVAYDIYTDRIVAVGEEAKQMLGRTPGHIIARRPMRDGVIADYRATERMLHYFLHKAVGKSLLRPDVIVCVPSQATQVQKRAVVEAATAAGAHHTYIIEEPLAAAIGAGLDISDPSGTLVVDIGGGTTDVALLSMGGIVISESLPVAGDAFDEAISAFVRHKYRVAIGERSAEGIKIALGSILNTDAPERVEVKGRSLVDGLPSRVYLDVHDLDEALDTALNQVVETVHRVLSDTPPELASDLFDKGILLTGGGSLIRGLDWRIRERTGLDVHYVDQPQTAVVRGTGKALFWIRKLQAGDEVLSDATRQQVVQRETLRKR